MAEDLKSKMEAIAAAKEQRKKQEAEAKFNAEIDEAREAAEEENALRDKVKALEAKVRDAQQGAREAKAETQKTQDMLAADIQQAQDMLADPDLKPEEKALIKKSIKEEEQKIENAIKEEQQKNDELNKIEIELKTVQAEIESLNKEDSSTERGKLRAQAKQEKLREEENKLNIEYNKLHDEIRKLNDSIFNYQNIRSSARYELNKKIDGPINKLKENLAEINSEAYPYERDKKDAERLLDEAKRVAFPLQKKIDEKKASHETWLNRLSQELHTETSNKSFSYKEVMEGTAEKEINSRIEALLEQAGQIVVPKIFGKKEAQQKKDTIYSEIRGLRSQLEKVQQSSAELQKNKNSSEWDIRRTEEQILNPNEWLKTEQTKIDKYNAELAILETNKYAIEAKIRETEESVRHNKEIELRSFDKETKTNQEALAKALELAKKKLEDLRKK